MKKLIVYFMLLVSLCSGATRDVVPRASNEGNLGTSSLKWSSINSVSGVVAQVIASNITATTLQVSGGITNSSAASTNVFKGVSVFSNIVNIASTKTAVVNASYDMQLGTTVSPAAPTGAGVYNNFQIQPILSSMAFDCTGGFAFQGFTTAMDIRSQFTGTPYIRGAFAYPLFGSSSSGTVAHIRGFDSGAETVAGSKIAITDVEHFAARDIYMGGGTCLNQYGLRVANLIGASNNYGVYIDGTTKSYFGGLVGIGTTSPAAKLHVAGDILATNISCASITQTVAGAVNTFLGRVGIGTNNVTNAVMVIYGGTNTPLRVISTAGIADRTAIFSQFSADASPPVITLKKARGNPDAPVSVSSGDRAGNVEFHGYDGYSYINSASIKVYSEGTVASNSVPMYMAFFAGTNNNDNAEAMRISSGRNVGIGTTTGTNILSIVQTSATDPIADSWTTYTCNRDAKDIVEVDVVKNYADELSLIPVYRWKRKPIVRDEEVLQRMDKADAIITTDEALMELATMDEKGVSEPVAEKALIVDSFEPAMVEAKRDELSTAKAALPKFQATHVGIMLDDPQIPREICANGDPNAGIDLVGWCGYLQAALRDEIIARKALKARLLKLEGR